MNSPDDSRNELAYSTRETADEEDGAAIDKANEEDAAKDAEETHGGYHY